VGELDDLFDDLAGDPRLAERVRGAGLDLVGHAEEDGGVGGTTYDAATVVIRVAQAGGDLDLTERLLVAAYVAKRTGIRFDPRACAVAVACDDLVAHGVAGLRNAETVLLVTPRTVTRLAAWSTVDSTNLAGQPRDTLRVDGPLEADFAGDLREGVRLLGALGRSCEIVGALRATLDLTVEYVSQRHQFGRPLLTQQLVQAHIAEIAEQLAATEATVAAVFDAGDDLDDPTRPALAAAIAAAKYQASTGAVVAARHAHQATGAMGMTREYPLGRLTSRLWAWSEEHGSSAFWADRLAASVDDHPDLWSLVGAPAASSVPRNEETTP
jgi:acyl-CoA dehydrogenase